MNNYPEEIIKQAKELIELHRRVIAGDWCKHQDDEPIIHINSIEAAIVSCEFAIQKIGKWKDFGCLMIKEQAEKIKAYLEGLL